MTGPHSAQANKKPRRRGRASESSHRQADNISSVMKRWCADRALPDQSWTEPLVVELYAMERAAGTWRPDRSHRSGGLKLESLAAVAPAIAAHGATLELDVSKLRAHDCVTRLLQHFADRLPFDQVSPVRSQPMTDDRLETFLSYIDRLAEPGVVHPTWACRWRVTVLVARAAALRPAEIVRMRFAWLEWRLDGPSPVIIITIPASKATEEAKTVVISVDSPSGLEAIQAFKEWIEELDRRGYRTAGTARVFPRVTRVAPERGAYHPVAGMTLSDFPNLATEYRGPLDPPVVEAGSTKKVGWQCSTCQGTWETKIQTRTSGGSGCPHCRRARNAAGLNAVPSADDKIEILDPIRVMVENLDWRPDRSRTRRLESAIITARNQLGKEYKKLAVNAGLSPRSEFEQISAYGPRRGSTVSLANADANRQTIRQTLRHEDAKASTPYIEERDVTLPPALTELDGFSVN